MGKYVEFYGPGLDDLVLADCATIANMAPEYGATCGIFRVNAVALDYLRSKHHRVAVLGADLIGDLAVQDRSTTPRRARSPR